MRILKYINNKLREYDTFIILVGGMAAVVLTISRLFGALYALGYVIFLFFMLTFNAGAHRKGPGEGGPKLPDEG